MLLRNTLCALAALFLSLLIANPAVANCKLESEIQTISKDAVHVTVYFEVACNYRDCFAGSIREIFTEGLKRASADYSIEEMIENEETLEKKWQTELNGIGFFGHNDLDIRYYSIPLSDNPDLEALRAEQDLRRAEVLILQYAEAIVSRNPNTPKTHEQTKRKIAELEQENQELREQVEYNQRVAGLRIAGVLLICLFIVAGWIIRRLKKGVKDTLDS
jgi:hypothetical protein